MGCVKAVEVAADLSDPFELFMDLAHLLLMHRPDHCKHHLHGLMKLFKHLLLKLAELLDQWSDGPFDVSEVD